MALSQQEKNLRDQVSSGKTYYSALGVDSHNTSDAEIKKAYRKLAKKKHPDVVVGNSSDPVLRKQACEAFNELQEAYENLQTSESRLKYLRSLEATKEKMRVEKKAAKQAEKGKEASKPKQETKKNTTNNYSRQEPKRKPDAAQKQDRSSAYGSSFHRFEGTANRRPRTSHGHREPGRYSDLGNMPSSPPLPSFSERWSFALSSGAYDPHFISNMVTHAQEGRLGLYNFVDDKGQKITRLNQLPTNYLTNMRTALAQNMMHGTYFSAGSIGALAAISRTLEEKGPLHKTARTSYQHTNSPRQRAAYKFTQ